MEKNKDVKVIYVIAIFLIYIFYSHCYKLLGWELVVTRMYYTIVALALILYNIQQRIKNYYKQTAIESIISILLTWPLISCLSSFFYGLDFFQELQNMYAWMCIPVFFVVFQNAKLDEKTLMTSLTCFAFISVVIQVFEQIYPDLAVFNVLDPDGENYNDEISKMRNNLYRLRPGCILTTMFCLFYHWSLFIKTLRYKNLIIFVVLLIGIYLELTRQIMISVLVTIFLFQFFSKNKTYRIHSMFFCIIFFFVIIQYWDVLFASLADSYVENQYTTDIRWECYGFIINQMFNDNIISLFGHGHPAIEPNVWWKKGYYMSDIGILGESFYYGLIWGCVYLYTLYYLFVKVRVLLPSYIKMFLTATLIISIFIFPYRCATEMLCWISMLYISSLYIAKENDISIQ